MKFSIIVPVYNIRLYLSQCIESVLTQKFEDFELILINDGSTDGSDIICDKYADFDSRIRVFHNENSGLSVARNIGVLNALGDYILFLDGDDFLDKEALLNIKEALNNNQEIEILTGKFIYYLNDSDYFVEDFELPSDIISEKNGEEVLIYYFKNINVGMWSACRSVFNRTFFVSNGFRFEPNLTSEDLALIPFVYLKANRISVVNKPFYYYRQNREGSIMNTTNAKRHIDMIKIVQTYEDFTLSNKHSEEFNKLLINEIAFIYFSYLKTIHMVNDNNLTELYYIYRKKIYLLKYLESPKVKVLKLLIVIFGVKFGSGIFSQMITTYGKFINIRN